MANNLQNDLVIVARNELAVHPGKLIRKYRINYASPNGYDLPNVPAFMFGHTVYLLALVNR
jgi:hypothetical protein